MVKVNTDVQGRALPCELYFDGYLYNNLQTMGELVAHKWDNVGFIVGYEGDGKSELAQIMALGLCAKFNLAHIVFTPEQFEEAVDKAEPGDSIVWDEADDLAASWYSDILHAIKKKLKTIRKKRLHILLVTPTIFDLNKYFVIARTRWAIHVYADGLKRGFFRFFNRDKKKTLYIKGQRDWNMKACAPNFRGRFTKKPKGFPIDEEAYEAKKDAATQGILEAGRKLSTPEIEANHRRSILERFVVLRKSRNWPILDYEIAEFFGVDRTTISKDKKLLELES